MDRSGGPFLLPAADRFGGPLFLFVLFPFQLRVVSDRVRLRFLVAVSGPVHAITERFFETD